MGALEEPVTARYKYGDITIGGRTIKFPPLSDRDPAGELGSIEPEWDDETAELGNEGLRDLFSREPVWPALAPDDPHSYIAFAQRAAVTCGLILYGGSCLALGFFIGWAVWGQ